MDEIISKFMKAKQFSEWNAKAQAAALYQEILEDPTTPKELVLTVKRELSMLLATPPPPSAPVPTPISEPVSTGTPTMDIHEVDPYKILLVKDIAEAMPITESEFETLREDIKARGIQNPLVVTPGMQLLCGYSRLRAAKELGLPTVPLMFKAVPPNKLLSYALLDNIKRRQLTPEQVAMYVGGIVGRGVGRPATGSKRKSNAEIAKQLGLSSRTVSRARAYVRKIKDNPQLTGKSIRSVLSGESSDRFTKTSDYTIGVDDDRIIDDFIESAHSYFDFDIHAGDTLKIVVQVYHVKRG